MKKQIIRLTENDLHQIIRNTVHSILRENDMEERHVLKLHHDEPPMDEPPMNEPPMDEPPMPPMNEPPMGGPDDGGMPPMDDPSAPPSGDEPPMDEPPTDEPNDGDPEEEDDENNNSEIDDIFDSLGIEDQSAVLKYAKSMANDSDEDEGEPSDMPMESKHYSNLDRLIEDVLEREVRGIDRTSKRNSKDIANDNLKGNRPFVSNR